MATGNALQFAIEIARIAHDNKSDDVIAMDMHGISTMTDFAVICTGTSDRQMRAVADQVLAYGRKVGERPFGLCGMENGRWIVLDFVDVVLHIFSRADREYYDLDLLWGDAPRIAWSRSETA